MTVSSSTDRATFAGNGVATAFSLPFRFFDNSDLVAQAIVDATGQVTPLTLGIDYTLTGAGQPEEAGAATGVLTTLVPVPAGVSLFAQRIIPVTQPTDIVNQARFFPDVHETVFDRLTMLAQQNDGSLGRALRVQDYDPMPMRIPSVAERANRILSFDADGNPVSVAPESDSATDVVLRLADGATEGNGSSMVARPGGGTVADAFGDNGANFIPWERSVGDLSSPDTGRTLSTFPHSVWEFAGLVTSKPTADPKSWDWTPAIQGGIDALSAGGGGELRLFPGTEFPCTGLTMKEGVVLNGLGPRMSNVMIFATPAVLPGAKIIHSGTADGIVLPSNAWGAAVIGLAINCSGQTSGHGIACDDAAGTLRPGQLLRDVLIYKAFDRGLLIKSGNREGRAERVFIRGGDSAADRKTVVGLDNSGVDWAINYCWSGFCAFRGISEKGGASRYDNIDVWSSGGRGVEITGSSSDWYRLQTDGCEGAGLEITGGDDVNLFGYVSLNNCASVAEYDIEITGDARNINFIAPKMRGAGAASLGAFRENTKNHVHVSGPRIATNYPERFNDRARAYWAITDASNPVRPLLPSLVEPLHKNAGNPYFANYATSAPVGWAVRNGGSAVLRTTDLPTEVLTGATITSSASGTSGIQLDLTSELSNLAGRRIRIRGMFKGDGTSATNDQRIQIQDGVINPIEAIPNNSTWEYVAIDYRVPLSAATLQIRLVAANGATAGKVLGATAVSVEFY